MIVDEAVIYLKAGKGGDGRSAFISRKGVRVGWGGDGSKGADIILKVSPHMNDLSKFRARKRFSAPNGNSGMENNKTGKTPDDLILYIPPGTLVRNTEGSILYDMNNIGDYCPIVRGGLPGKGNYKRRYATEGKRGEEKDIVLDYRIPNDVAILGLPNSGKTSLFNSLTGKHFKVGEYPFTSTVCAWSQFEIEFKVFTVLDMPALVNDSNRGKGLGNRFLKHLYRTKMILIIADAAGNYREDFSIIRRQIELFEPSFIDKKVFYLLTKADKIESKNKLEGSLSVSVNDDDSLRRLKELIFKSLYYEKGSNKSRQQHSCSSGQDR